MIQVLSSTILLCDLLLRGLDDKATGDLVRVIVNVFRKHDMKHAKQFAGYGDKRLHRFKRILRAMLIVLVNRTELGRMIHDAQSCYEHDATKLVATSLADAALAPALT